MRLASFILLLCLLISVGASLFLHNRVAAGMITFFAVFAGLVTYTIYSVWKQKFSLAGSIALLIGSIVVVSLSWTGAPLKIAFQAHQEEFDAISSKLIKGEEVSFPLWIGPFRFVDGGVRKRGDSPETPYLAANTNRYEVNGFVRNPDGSGFNLWTMLPLNDQWSYVEED